MFATTFVDGFKCARFRKHAREIKVPPRLDTLERRKFHLVDEIKLFIRVIKAGFKEKSLLLFSSRGHLKPELLAMIFIGFWPKRYRPVIVMYGEMFEPNRGVRATVEKIVMWLVDRAVSRYIVYSSAEFRLLPFNWGMDVKKIRLCHYFFQSRISKTRIGKADLKHIFAGGNSHRDYSALIETARMMPEQKFITSFLTRMDLTQITTM